MKTQQNKVHMIGIVLIAPEIATLENGKKVARMTIGTPEIYRDEATGKNTNETQFHQLVAWGKTATIAEKFLTKGSHIAIEGKLVNRSYFDKEGVKRYVTKIEVFDVIMLEGGIENES